MKTHLRGLDGLRGLAACSVLVYHVGVFAPPPSPGWLAKVSGVGWVGVDVFFAISGFILFLPFARAARELTPPVRIGRYATNRVRRILPAYLLNLFALVTLGAAGLAFDRRGAEALVANLTFTAGYTGLPKVNGVYWTLFCEVAFYATLPVIALLLVKRRWLLGLPLLLAATTAYKVWVFATHGPPVERGLLRGALEQFPGVLDQFVMGMLIALVWVALERRGRNLSVGSALALSTAGIVGVIGLLWFLQSVVGPPAYWAGSGPLGWLPLLLIKPLISLCAAVAILGICMRDTPVTAVLELRPLRYLGTVSFGIYLWHLPLAKMLAGEVQRGAHPLRHFAATLLLVFLASLAWAALSHHLVEQPFLRRKALPPTTDEDVAAGAAATTALPTRSGTKTDPSGLVAPGSSQLEGRPAPVSH